MRGLRAGFARGMAGPISPFARPASHGLNTQHCGARLSPIMIVRFIALPGRLRRFFQPK